MATLVCRVQFLDDTDPFNSTSFPEPTRPPQYTFREDIPLINQIAGVHRLLRAPHKLDDCALQLSHNGTYLDLESTLAEQRDELEGFQEDTGRGRKHSVILRTQLSVRVHACIGKLPHVHLHPFFQDDKDLVHEFVVAEGLTCLIKVGAEADQNYQNYILRALGQIMLYVDGMNGVMGHSETIQWLYSLIGSKFRLVVKTALKLLLVFVEYAEPNAALLVQAVTAVDTKRGCKLWSNAMEILDEKDGVDTELLVYAMTLINKTLAGLPDQDSFYDLVDALEEQGMEAVSRRHLNRKGTDLDLVEQFNMYEATLRHEDGDDDSQPPPTGRRERRRSSVEGGFEKRGLERRRSRRHSLGRSSAPASPSSPHGLTHTSSFLEEYEEEEEEESPITESNTEEEEEEEEEGGEESSRQGTDLPLPAYPNSAQPSILASLLVQRKSSFSIPPSVETGPHLRGSVSPSPERLPYLVHSPFHLFSYDFDEEDTCASHKAGQISFLLTMNIMPLPLAYSLCPFRPALGGLLTSSYRQHQESLAAERERRRLEREERLLRIEREERNQEEVGELDKEGQREKDECDEEVEPEHETEDNAILSEKERQNEEVNEKDNCSASSISSTSSTLEREERLNTSNETGQWTQCIKDVDVNEQCSAILNNKLFMLDMLYAQNKKPLENDEEEEEEEDHEKDKGEKGRETEGISVSDVVSSQSCEDSVKNTDVQNLENQGSVRAFAEKFGDVVKGLVSPPLADTSDKRPEPEKPAPTSLPPKKESDYIWDQLMASPRELRIRDIDFTDLGEEDDVDILDVSDSLGKGDGLPPPPPPPSFSNLPPPPPLFGCPPPPPILGSPQLSRAEPPLFQKKKKTIRLFWSEVRPVDCQFQTHKQCRDSLWSKLEPVKVDTSKLEHLFESKSKEMPVTKKTAADGKRQEIIVLDSKRSNAINIGLTVLPPPRTIKTAILSFDEYALNKEGIEKILTMIPTEEEKQKIQEAQLANPDVPLGSAEQFLLTLSSISELSARLQLWAFKMDYEVMEKEVAEPLQDLKEGMDQLENNKTLRYILSTLLAIGNFLNGSTAKGFELSYLEKVPEVKDTVHKQSLLHHACTIVVEKFPDSTDLYSEIGAITRTAKVDFDQLQENLCQMERRCKASWDHLKVIAKHEMKPALKQKMSDFLKDCAERIIILKIVHRRIINRFHAFLLFLGHPSYAVREVSIQHFSKTMSEFALEYRTTRDRVLQQKQKRADHRERNKTRGKMITDSGKLGNTAAAGQESEPQGLHHAEDAAEHEHMTAVLKTGRDSEASAMPGLRVRTRASRGRLSAWANANDESPNATDDAADEIMERIVKSATQGPSQRAQPRERKRSRANRKSLRRTLKSGLTPEEAHALGLVGGPEMQV
uniref:FH1/FH2 domain-containing protein 3-like n=1 Tax=Scleropages formosus TaxID=113540 RepID=A0A8C9TWL0_SCLFO